MLSKLERVLVVDDNRIVRIVLREFFEQLGVEVVEAKDGLEASELIPAYKPQLLVADILMPRRDGFALAEECLAMDESVRPYVFLTTAVYKSRQNEQEALTTYGAYAFFRKPIDLEELKARVGDLFTVG